MKNIKRILFVANQAPVYKVPFFNLLYTKLKKIGYETEFFFTHQKNVELKAKFKILGGVGYKKYKIFPSLPFKILKYDLIFFLPPDPLHLIDNILMFITCKIFKKQYIIWTERWRYKKSPVKDKISLIFYKRIIRRSNALIVIGEKQYEWAKELKMNMNKVFVVLYASTISFNKKEIGKKKKEIIKKYNLKNKKIILYAGRLIKRKGIDYLIRAFSGIKDKNVILMIIGGKDFYKLGEKTVTKELINLIKEYKLSDRIIITGEVPHEQLPAFYSIADLFILPSTTEKIGEPWGLVLNEAMQFGLPVIATDAVGAAYNLIKEGKNGFMVPEKDVGAMSSAIKKIITNQKLRKSMGLESRKIIKKGYTYGHMVKGFKWVIDSYLG